ncbi:endo alpha-1,4 polygalactosaminidase [Blastococcus sp. TF02-09]|uniref:endo alpha-1,4 polygalactosaminidase n=1 Tax=Blastococcus sp. TF02-09 TaxID=2250576 RepID=UPI0018F5DC7E|nr:endo alpha-1,4 polygalactosaminidase [Blastococcus sp. TF02-9]
MTGRRGGAAGLLALAAVVLVAAGCSASGPADDGATEPWRPAAGTTWQYQLSGPLDVSADAAVFVVDGAETTAEQVRQLHDRDRRVVCYVNVGAHEDWRDDAARFPADVVGAPLDGWPGERWLDVRRTDVLLPLLAARFDVCRDKGFDAVEGDNVDGYANESGFPLESEEQLAFNRAVADLAHDRGLAIGLKNDVDQLAELEPSFDFAINEECAAFDECGAYAPFVRAGKAVLHVEYAAECPRAVRGLSTIVKDLDLGAPLRRC